MWWYLKEKLAVCALKTERIVGGPSLQMCLCEMVMTLFLTFILTCRASKHAESRAAALESCAVLKTHCFDDLILNHQKYLEQSAFSVF